ncbi:phosphotransferase family protein [Actinoplanes xinjiangensis]|uniref:phosphotransferase family protein n=1 Tax=Actinoplanes xinjiangensis TaxID=512350 RepID=UPI00343A8378
MSDPIGKLSPRQRALLDVWLPGAQVVRDHSWGIVETTVLEILHSGRRLIMKAGGAADHHIARELRAHREWLTPWTDRGRAPSLVHGDVDAKLLVTTYLPGELVSGADPDVFRQAGELLALLHGRPAGTDDYERRENAKCLKLLDGPHRIAPAMVDRLRALITGWPTAPEPVVPTHGDWQPRNWLIHEGVVSVIDFGRAALRPAYTDLSRLAAQDFRDDPTLETAFFEGYGSDPRTAGGWDRGRMREAIGTACWAYVQGIDDFEAQGHRMIAEALPEDFS